MLCQDRQCHDPRDTVYGTFALADWSGATSFTPDGRVLYTEGSPDRVFKPDYTRSTFDLAKEILLHFELIGDMWHVLHMLRIKHTDPRIVQETRMRQQVPLEFKLEHDDDVVDLAMQCSQDRVQVVGGLIHLTSDCPWRLKCIEQNDCTYTSMTDCEGRSVAVASPNVQLGDWLWPTGRCFGFVLRKYFRSSRYWVVVGRAACSIDIIPEDYQMTAFMLWLGVEDLLVHLAHGDAFLFDWDEENGPEEGLLAILNLPFCIESCSSFAEIPLVHRQWSEEEFRLQDRAIAFTLLADWHRRCADSAALTDVADDVFRLSLKDT